MLNNALQKIEELEAINGQLLEVCEKVEWICDPVFQDENIKFCPWCFGIKPDQWNVNFKAQELEVNIGHSEDCLRQAAIAAAKGE